MISIIKEFVETLEVANLELEKENSNLVKKEKDICNITVTIEKLVNTYKDLSSGVSSENLDDLENHELKVMSSMKSLKTEHQGLKEAKEEHAKMKNTLSSKAKVLYSPMVMIHDLKIMVVGLQPPASSLQPPAIYFLDDQFYPEAVQ